MATAASRFVSEVLVFLKKNICDSAFLPKTGIE